MPRGTLDEAQRVHAWRRAMRDTARLTRTPLHPLAAWLCGPEWTAPAWLATARERPAPASGEIDT